MIRIPVPEEYCGQEFFYTNQNDDGGFGRIQCKFPVEVITDNEDMLPISKQKKDMEIGSLPNFRRCNLLFYSQWRNKENTKMYRETWLPCW